MRPDERVSDLQGTFLRDVLTALAAGGPRTETRFPLAWVALAEDDGSLRVTAVWDPTGIVGSPADLPPLCDRLRPEALSFPAVWTDECGCLRRFERLPAGSRRCHGTLPLRDEDRFLGVVNVVGLFSPSDGDQALLALTGTFLNLALRQARLHAAVRSARWQEQAVLLDLARKFLVPTEPKTVVETTFSVLREHLRPDAVSLLEPDERTAFLDLTFGEGWSQAYVGRLRLPLTPPESSGVAWAVYMRRWVVWDPTREDPPVAVPEPVQQAGVRKSLILPLLTSDRVQGVLVLDSLEDRDFTDDEVRFADLVAHLMAVAMERARQYQVLRETQARYRDLFERVPVGLYRTTPDGRILDANPALVQMLGHPDLKSLQAVPVPDLYLDPEDRRRWQEAIERTGVVEGFEFRVRRRDGTVLWVRDSARCVYDHDGQVVCYEGVVEDVTQRRRAECLLAAEKQVLEMIAAGRPLSEVLTAMVRSMEDLADGLRGSVLLLDEEGRRLRHGAAPSLPEAYNRLIDGLVIGPDVGTCGTAAYLGQVVVTPDITTDPRWADYRDVALQYGLRACWSVPVFSTDGRVLGTFAMYYGEPRYPTPWEMELIGRAARLAGIAIEAERAREQLRRQARRLERILESAAYGMVLLDGSGRVLLANPKGAEYLRVLAGVGVGDILTRLGDRPLASLVPSPDEVLWHEVTLEEPTGEEATPGPHETVWAWPVARSRTHRRVFEVARRPVVEAEAAEGSLLVLREVTQEREAQLYAQTRDRLAAIGQLAAGIAHDFNNILTSILGLAELLQMRPDDPSAVQRHAGVIHAQGERAAQMIRQVLDFARKTVAEQKALNLAAFLKEYAVFVRRVIPESIEIRVEVETEDAWIWGNEVQIHQVLTNLAVNARDAMPEGGRLTFRLTRTEVLPGQKPPLPGMAPGSWVTVEVTDTGVGILPEVLPHIFEPFFTTKRPGQGTGLGLAQVYGIVQQHGGHIGVRSRPGEGTTFVIYLPCRAPEARAGVPETARPEAARFEGMVLLVEDEPKVLEVIREMLESLGFQVLATVSPVEALRLYEAHRPAIRLVLSDAVMPEMSGPELLVALRARDPDVRVVFMSGYPLGSSRGTSLPDGVPWIQKPFRRDALAEVIRRVLSLRERV
jgi:PAS domain S-box-containing protein